MCRFFILDREEKTGAEFPEPGEPRRVGDHHGGRAVNDQPDAQYRARRERRRARDTLPSRRMLGLPASALWQ